MNKDLAVKNEKQTLPKTKNLNKCFLQVGLNLRNNLLMLHKTLPKKGRNSILLQRRLNDTLAFFQFALKFDLKNAHAIIKAHNDVRKMKNNYDTNPEKNLLNEFKGGNINIVHKYYRKGIKKFSDLKI